MVSQDLLGQSVALVVMRLVAVHWETEAQAAGRWHIANTCGSSSNAPGDRSATNPSQQALVASLVHLLAQPKPCSLASDL